MRVAEFCTLIDHNLQVPPELEICCYNVDDALVAQHAGADRIELCAGRPEGGTTPSIGVLRDAIDSIGIPTFPMVRPRGGGFCYDSHEFAAMKTDVATIVELGFPGVVFGVLTTTSAIDEERCRELIDIARGLRPDVELTFHRAFDEVAQPLASYQTLNRLGFNRVLTSGQQTTASAGSELIRELISRGNDPIVMPGGGVRPHNIADLIELGATNLHSSAQSSTTEGVNADIVRSLAEIVHRP